MTTIDELKDIIVAVSSHFAEDKKFPEKFIDILHKKLKKESNQEKVILEVFQEMGKENMVPFYHIYVKEREKTYQNLKQDNKITLLVGPTSSDEYIPWETKKIAQALEREGGIPKDIAEKMALEVEHKVISSGSRYISTALIRDLVNTELFLNGYGYYVKKQTALRIPKYNLNNLLYPRNGNGSVKNASQLENQISGNIFKQYALEEVFSKEVAKAHLTGSIHIENLECPIKYFSINSDIPSEFQIKKTSDIENIIELLAGIQRVSQFISHSFNIYSIDTEEMNWNKTMLKSFLSGLAQNSTINYNFILHKLNSSFTDNLHKCYKNYSKHDKYNTPRFWIPIDQHSFNDEKSLKKICQISQTTQNINFYFKQESLYTKKNEPITGCAMNAFVINLLKAVVNTNEKEELWSNLKNIFDLTVKGYLDKKRFLFNVSSGPLTQLLSSEYNNICNVDIRDSICFLSIAGLPEAIEHLCDSDMTEGEGWELAIEILEKLNEMALNLEKLYDIRIKLVDYSNSKATQHFSRVRNIKKSVKYTFGPHFPETTLMNDRERILKEGQLHNYIKSYVNVDIKNFKNYKSMLSLLQFTHEETNANILRIT